MEYFIVIDSYNHLLVSCVIFLVPCDLGENFVGGVRKKTLFSPAEGINDLSHFCPIFINYCQGILKLLNMVKEY